MTSKNLFFKLIKEEWKRKLWLAALSLLTFFFAFPVGIALKLSSSAERYDRMVERGTVMVLSRSQFLSEAAESYVSSSGDGIIVFLIFTAAIVCGAASFSYLHNKRKVDFYHSVPVKREMLFSVSFLTGILIPAVSYLVCLILSAGVAAGYGTDVGKVLSSGLLGWGFHMLYFWFIYSVTVLAMVLTGNLIVGLLGSLVFFIYFPVLGAILDGYFSTFFHTYSTWAGKTTIGEFLVKLSPAADYFMAYGKLSVGEGCSMLLFGSGAAAAVITAISLILHRRRPSEAAGKAMAFAPTKPVIRIALVFLFGMMGGLFFWSLQSTVGWAVFGSVAGTVLCHCIVEIIYHFDFRKLFSHKIQLAVCAAAGLGVLLCFEGDWMGYDVYLPEGDKVAEAAIDLGRDYWITYDEIAEDGQGNLILRQGYNQEYLSENMKVTSIDPILEIAAKGIESTLRGDEELVEEDYWTSVNVCYTLKSGRTVQRSYNLPLSLVLDSVKVLWNDPAYQNGKYPVLSRRADEVVKAEYKVGSDGVIIQTGELEPEQAKELLAAYQEEFRALDIDTMAKENPVATIRFLNELETSYLDMKVKEEDYDYDSWSQGGGFYPVYPSFAKTLAILKEAGMDPERAWDAVEVEKIEVEDSFEEIRPGSGEISYANYIDYVVTYEDGAKMKEILSAFTLSEYGGMNFFSKVDSPLVRVTIKNGNGTRTEVAGNFVQGKTPDFVRQDLKTEEDRLKNE